MRFAFVAKTDVRTFRDGNGYVVDVVNPDMKPGTQGEGGAKTMPMAALQTAPLEKAAAAAAAEAPAPATDKANAAPATIVAPSPAAPARPEAKPATLEIKPAVVAQIPTAPPVAAAVPPPPPAAPPADMPAAHAQVSAAPPARGGADTVAVDLSHQGANVKLLFPFPRPTAAAIFQRADTLWLVFDATAAIDLSALEGEASRTIRAAEFSHAADAAIVRIRLDRPHLASAITEGATWSLTIGDSVSEPTRALERRPQHDRSQPGEHRHSF